MGIFNLIETFFYLSLGVCFVLIILLVYHFKQRLLSLEEKTDTLVDIISNVVREISNIKNSAAVRPPSMFEVFENPLYKEELSQAAPFPEMSFYMKEHLRPTTSLNVEELEIEKNGDKEDDEEEDEEDEEDEDDEEEDEDEDDEEEDEDDEEEDQEESVDNRAEEEFLYEREQKEETKENLPEELQEVALTTTPYDSKEEDESTIRIVSIPLNQVIQDGIFEMTDDLETETEVDEPELEPETVELNETEPIVVNKLEETVLSDIQESSVVPDPANVEETLVLNEKAEKHESYRKMNVQQLRALVISNGLSTNTSKLNKTELIKLLESMDE